MERLAEAAFNFAVRADEGLVLELGPNVAVELLVDPDSQRRPV